MSNSKITKAHEFFTKGGDFNILVSLYRPNIQYDCPKWEILGNKLGYDSDDFELFKRINPGFPLTSLLKNWFPEKEATAKKFLDVMKVVDYNVYLKLEQRAEERGIDI